MANRGFPRLLYSYIISEILVIFFASVLIINSIFFLGRLIPFLGVVISLGVGFTDFIRLFVFLFPNMLLYSLPMASMMAVIIAFTRLSNDSEILALKAAGVSVPRLLPPVLIVAIFTAGLTGYFSVKLIPVSDQAMKRLTFHLVQKKVGQSMKARQFSEDMGNIIVYVDDIDQESGEWHGVYVADLRWDGLPVITIASAGHLEADLESLSLAFIFENGSLHRGEGDITQTIQFERYELVVPVKMPTMVDGDLTYIGKKGRNLAELQAHAAAVAKTHPHVAVSHLLEYHKRLALPVGCLILSLLGLPLGLQSGVGKKAAGIPLGLVFFIFYYVLFTAGKSLAKDYTLTVFWASWLPNLIFALITIFAFYQTSREQRFFLIVGGEKLLNAIKGLLPQKGQD